MSDKIRCTRHLPLEKPFVVLNVLLAAAVVFSSIYYLEHGTLRLKAITSLLFSMIGAVNLLWANLCRAPLGYPSLLAAGLFFAMLGDIRLGYSFAYGALLFGIGHALYFAAFCTVTRTKVIDLIPVAIIFAGSALFLKFYPKLRFGGPSMFNLCMGYALVISFMTGKSISVFLRTRSAACAVAMLGSIFFFVSDLMLVLYMFARAGSIADTLCLIFYFPGQSLIGLSSYLQIKRTSGR